MPKFDNTALTHLPTGRSCDPAHQYAILQLRFSFVYYSSGTLQVTRLWDEKQFPGTALRLLRSARDHRRPPDSWQVLSGAAAGELTGGACLPTVQQREVPPGRLPDGCPRVWC